MKEITKEEERLVRETKTVYVAYDGTEFDHKRSCQRYEKEKRREEALHREDVEELPYLNRLFPEISCCGDSYDSSCDLIWVRPKTEDAVRALTEAYLDDIYSCNGFKVGRMSCIVFEEWSGSVIEVTSEDDLWDECAEFFSHLGYDIIRSKRNDHDA